MDKEEWNKIIGLPEEDKREVLSYLASGGPSIALADLHPRTFYLVAYGGRSIVPHKKAKEIIEGLTRFYNKVPKEYIENYNQAQWEEFLKGVEPNESVPLQPKNRPGYVYFLESENSLVKIGMTTNLQERISSLEYNLPVKVRLKGSLKVKDRVKAERLIHEYFSSKRLENSEWFQLSIKDWKELRNAGLPLEIENLIIEEGGEANGGMKDAE